MLRDEGEKATFEYLRSSVLAGILWHQGESDCVSEEKFAEYKPKFLNFINQSAYWCYYKTIYKFISFFSIFSS